MKIPLHCVKYTTYGLVTSREEDISNGLIDVGCQTIGMVLLSLDRGLPS